MLTRIDLTVVSFVSTWRPTGLLLAAMEAITVVAVIDVEVMTRRLLSTLREDTVPTMSLGLVY